MWSNQLTGLSSPTPVPKTDKTLNKLSVRSFELIRHTLFFKSYIENIGEF